MRSTWFVAAALAALAGCGSSTPSQPIGFSEPSAVAVFRGHTPKYADVHPYVAVANAARGDLTILDAWDDTPVLAPVVVRSLAVPVPVVRPAMLASSSLADGADADATQPALPDLLVVAAPGSNTLQLVSTWSPTPRVVDAQEVDLGLVAPGASVLTMAAVPVLDATTGLRVAGVARIVVSLTGGRLAVVDYRRATAGTDAGVAIVAGPAALQPLVAGGVPFDAVSLAVNPALPAHLYAASPDPIGGVEGVADLTISGVPGTWTIDALDARAPTTVVAAARLRERAAASADDFETAFFTATVDRVYAALDPARCGPTQRTPCGIAVLNPGSSGGSDVVPDYTLGVPMPYLAPIQVPGVPLAISIALPPKNPPSSSADDARFAGTLMKIAPPSGVRGTTAVAAVASSDGRVYFVDLGRWSIPNTSSILRASTRTIVSATGATVITPSPRQLALWKPSTTGGEGTLLKTGLEAGVTITPGFTTSETWTVSYQGPLPGLELHKGDTGRAGNGATWVALQVHGAAPGGGETLTQVVRVTDPSLGIHVGDVVRVLPAGVAVTACVDPTPAEAGGTAAAEATVADILPPTAAYPGGALALAPALTDPRYDPTRVVDETHPQIGYDWPACIGALAEGTQNTQVEVRAGDFLVVGSLSGYAGRTAVQYAAPGAPSFSLTYANEDAISCPDPAACTDASCRPACEQLALVRKARRIYHVSDACRVSDIGDECNRLWPGAQFPRHSGPVVAFSLGYVPDPSDEGGAVPTDPKLRSLLRASLKLTITTASGISPTAFRPGTGSGSASSYPLAATTFDRSVVPGKQAEGYRFYVPFVDAFVLDFSPSEAPTVAKILR